MNSRPPHSLELASTIWPEWHDRAQRQTVHFVLVQLDGDHLANRRTDRLTRAPLPWSQLGNCTPTAEALASGEKLARHATCWPD